MKLNNLAALMLASIVLLSCNTTKEEKKLKSKVTSKETNEGYTLFKNNCYACHSVISKSHDEIIAPPMVAVKRRYKMAYNSKEEFVKAVVAWASDPKEDNALMRGAVNQFKVMPKQLFKKEDLIKIAGYIYDNEIEQPAWFKSHFNTMHPNGMGGKKGMKMNN
ncbi:c-type cytochrome [Lutibacter sp.]|uniref:c-type cytochrome n=1 Tax=Lutibacter sp. TaxID=1925666 RepID=UPI0025C4000E|nr:c-type cytochrome [Lutibacter sp.]MCF6167007.1 cytochrome c [Lutibacter sp.]